MGDGGGRVMWEGTQMLFDLFPMTRRGGGEGVPPPCNSLPSPRKGGTRPPSLHSRFVNSFPIKPVRLGWALVGRGPEVQHPPYKKPGDFFLECRIDRDGKQIGPWDRMGDMLVVSHVSPGT